MTSDKAIVTIVAKNYLAQARVLMKSVKQFNPELLRIVILVDDIDDCFDPGKEDFIIILSSELGIPESKWFHFKYTVLELSTAVKPYALEFLLRRYELQKLFYLDPDIAVYHSLTCLLDCLDSANILLTPHLTAPLDDGHHPGELDILRSGAYNLGFLGIANSQETLAFLHWWQARLFDKCVVDVARGLFVDQRWVDLVPGLFDGVSIIREPGYNVAYWNLHDRQLRREGARFTVDSKPLYFFHFSGFDPHNPEVFSRHQDRFRFADLGDARFLVLEYRRALLESGYNICHRWPYRYGCFANGFPIPDMGRATLHEAPDFAVRFEDPFCIDCFQAFVQLWNEPASPGRRSAGVTRLAYRIYRSRTDVMAEMPDIFGQDYVRFLEWLLSSGRREHDLDNLFLAPVYDSLSAVRRHLLSQTPVESREQDPDLAFIPPICQSIIRQRQDDGIWARIGGDVGHGEPESLNVLLAQGEGLQLTKLAKYIYETRPDLQRFFPDPCGSDGPRFLIWFLTYGKSSYQLGDLYTAPLREQWDNVIARLGNPLQRLRYRLLLLAMCATVRLRAMHAWFTTRGRFMLSSIQLRISSIFAAQPPAPPTADTTAHQPFQQGGHLGCNLVGYLRGEMGVGQSARNAATAAESAGIQTCLCNIEVGGPQSQRDESVFEFSNAFPHRVNVYHVNADQTEQVHGSLGARFSHNRYNIGFWAWELEEFPDCWGSAFRPYQEIWVPSSFCQDAIARKATIPVLRLPHAVAVELNGHRARTDFGIPEKSFLYLTMFDALSVLERKNPRAVIEAFIRAFGGEERVELIVKVSHAEGFQREMQSLRSAAAGYPIRIIDSVLPRKEVNALIQACDCLVSLHRSEGFGFSMAEAMCLSKPVIATAYSGNLDFTKANNSFLVDYRMIPVGPGCSPYPASSFWADPSIDDAANQMRLVFDHSELRAARAAAGAKYVAQYHSPTFVGGLMKDRLEQIARKVHVQGLQGVEPAIQSRLPGTLAPLEPQSVGDVCRT